MHLKAAVDSQSAISKECKMENPIDSVSGIHVPFIHICSLLEQDEVQENQNYGKFSEQFRIANLYLWKINSTMQKQYRIECVQPSE